MRLGDLFENIPIKSIVHYDDREVAGVAIDTRREVRGKVFVCLRGTKTDGHDFAAAAVREGAVAVVAEHPVEVDVPLYIVENARKTLSLLCGNYYGNPAREMNLITVVGTNGKTSTVEILADIFRYAGKKVATIGTLGYRIDAERHLGELTTPDPIELHANLAAMKKAGVEYVFMEASAHAIHYDKLAGIKAKASVLTNITQDHLDFFTDMESYANTKLSYFTHENTALGVLNSDDPYSLRLIREPKIPIITYGVDNPADVFAIDISDTDAGLRFTLNAFDCITEVLCPLHGRFNVYNVMAATTVAMFLGVDILIVRAALSQLSPVPGRYNVLRVNGKQVVVDYAHTPDGLENLLRSVRSAAKGKVVTVFGCGGDRDKGKRPLMGRISGEYSDHSIITEDNPRFERECDIFEDIRRGIAADRAYERIDDRAEAIRHALSLVGEDDVLVIAGKGHEGYIEREGVKYPYSDYEILQQLEGQV